MKIHKFLSITVLFLALAGCSSQKKEDVNVNEDLEIAICNHIYGITNNSWEDIEITDELWEPIIRTKSDRVKAAISNSDAATIDIDSIFSAAGLFREDDQIYIIDQSYKVVNTTLEIDQGLDLGKFGPELRNQLFKVLEGQKFSSEQSSLSNKINQFVKYSYDVTDDGKYIIQISSNPHPVNKIAERLKEQLNAFEIKTPYIQSVDLFLGSVENNYSFNHPGNKVDTAHHKAYKEVLDFKQSIIHESNDSKYTDAVIIKGDNVRTQYTYLPVTNNALFLDMVLRVVWKNDPVK